jgi:hypothetical protein
VFTRLSAALAALVLVAIAAGPTAAAAGPQAAPAVAAVATATPTACGDQLTVLRSDVLVVPITSGKVERERAGLIKLVDDATALVAAGKTTDAVVKLENLQTKVDQLAAGERISAESEALLTADLGAATGCILSV